MSQSATATRDAAATNAGDAQAASACCSATKQQVCCEPAEKASCCGAPSASQGANSQPAGCGCQ